MKNLIRKFTMGKPKQLIGPAVWIFIENFFMSLSAVFIYFVIAILVEGFEGLDQKDMSNLVFIAICMGILLALQIVISICTFRQTFLPGARNSAANKKEFVQKLRKLPLGFFMNKKPGELINTFAGDFLAIEQSMVGGFVGIFSVIAGTGMAVIFLLIFNAPMALALYAALPIAILMCVLSLRLVSKFTTQIIQVKDQAAGSLNEYIFGMKTLRAFNQAGKGFTKLREAYEKLMKACVRAEVVGGSLINLASSVVQIGLPLMCFVGAYLILGGNLGLVEYLGLIVIGTKILAPAITWIQFMVSIRMHYVSANRIDAVMQQEEMGGSRDKTEMGKIAFDNVSFSYKKGDEAVLNKLSFTVPEHKLTAIVGPSGGGKTTILRLIARFWDVDSGEIRCNNNTLAEINPDTWLANVSMVLQEVYLFNVSIRDNILFGRKDASEEDMIDAAKRARCHDFIMELPDGYDTIVGEGGSTLSGGEKQRISIARALLKDAPLLLLDEPTSSLDARNEVYIQQALNELVKGRTVVMIAHRLKTVQRAHQILVLDKGSIVQSGTHDMLMESGGLYRHLWTMQNKSINWNF